MKSCLFTGTVRSSQDRHAISGRLSTHSGRRSDWLLLVLPASGRAIGCSRAAQQCPAMGIVCALLAALLEKVRRTNFQRFGPGRFLIISSWAASQALWASSFSGSLTQFRLMRVRRRIFIRNPTFWSTITSSSVHPTAFFAADFPCLTKTTLVLACSS